jgi:hypothetical protein
MSALGQKQTYAAQQVMSALPPKADIDWSSELLDFKNQFALQMTSFADQVRLSDVSKPVPNDRGRPDSIGVKKSQHSLEVSTIANDVRP